MPEVTFNKIKDCLCAIAIITALVGSMLYIGVAFKIQNNEVKERIKNERKIKQEYLQTRKRALLKCADTNFNAILEPAEITGFESNFYARNNLTLINGDVFNNKTGEEASLEALTEMLKNYEP